MRRLDHALAQVRDDRLDLAAESLIAIDP